MEEEICTWYDVGCTVNWIAEEFWLILQGFWNYILAQLALLVEMIPVPDFLVQLQNSSFQIPSSVLFWTDMFQVPFGLAVMVGAMVARFVLRRIPLIG